MGKARALSRPAGCEWSPAPALRTGGLGWLAPVFVSRFLGQNHHPKTPRLLLKRFGNGWRTAYGH